MAKQVHLLDYGAGNVRSVRNSIQSLGYEVIDIVNPEDIEKAQKLVFPGVGSFGSAMTVLNEKGWTKPLKRYLEADRPFFGICLGMQTLFEYSEESPGLPGLGLIKGTVTKFKDIAPLSVPHIGWNGVNPWKNSSAFDQLTEDLLEKVYFVHSFCALKNDDNHDWILTTTNYGCEFISSVQRGNVVATQFHPEKSGGVGLRILDAFLKSSGSLDLGASEVRCPSAAAGRRTELAKRVIACLDVRSNDAGDLVVTKGDQYDVREEQTEVGKGAVRNLGKPVELCARYYEEGADEVSFLNITSFKNGAAPVEDLPMLAVLQSASSRVFVPLTVGGGIRDYTDAEGKTTTSLEMASLYFRGGADKISIGSDAVFAAERWLQTGQGDGSSSLEQISRVYGSQAVVVSIDPKRVYVATAEEAGGHAVVTMPEGTRGPNGEELAWYQATIKGGRETRDVDAVQLARAAEALGAGEIMLNCIDHDGQNSGYDVALISAVKEAVSIPVIASSGAGVPKHFTDVFEQTNVEAALAAGIFHRKEVAIAEVKAHLTASKIPVRTVQ